MLRIGACALFAAAGLSAGDVVNGSFENLPLNNPGRTDIGNLQDWTATGGFMLLERGVNSISGIAAHSGQQFVSMGHSGASGDRLSQVIDTVAGDGYVVEFYLHVIQGPAVDQTVRVAASDDVGGADLGMFDAVATDPANGWTRFEFTFEAISDSTEISFTHQPDNGNLANVAIDSVTVVPAPAAGLFASIGLAGVARRKRSS